MDERLLTPEEVAEYFGTTVKRLAQDRYLGSGPKYVKFGKLVRYRRADLEALVDAQTFAQTGGVR